MTSRTNQANGDHHRLRPYAPTGSRADYLGPSSYASSSAASLKGCCCCLFLLLTFLALLTIAVILVIVLAVKPKKPQFDLQQVAVQYLLVSPAAAAAVGTTTSTPPAAYLSLNITLLFTAENPNKVGIRYRETKFVVMYRGVPVGVATVPGFEQPAHSTRLVQTWVSVSRFNVLQGDALDLIRDATVNDRVELHLTGDVGAKIRVLGFTSPGVQVSVDCAIGGRPSAGLREPAKASASSILFLLSLLLSFLLLLPHLRCAEKIVGTAPVGRRCGSICPEQ